MRLSNAVDICGYAALAYGAYVFGGRGAAAFVAGGAFLLLSYVSSEREISFAHVFNLLRRRRREEPKKRHRFRPGRMITNADFDKWMTEGRADHVGH